MFSNARLMMGADATEGYCVSGLLDVSHEFLAIEDAIVSMVVLDFDSKGSSISFERSLCLNGHFSIRTLLNVDVTEFRGLINKNSSYFVAFSS